ncbi:MAG: hypothetical protein ACKOFZ_03015 [Ilumatobacteraceae bacterium]
MLLISNNEPPRTARTSRSTTHPRRATDIEAILKLEIWVTDLPIEPQVVIEGNVLKLHLNASDNLTSVIESSNVPDVLADHLHQLWEGECPDRIFRIVDDKTVVITTENEPG